MALRLSDHGGNQPYSILVNSIVFLKGPRKVAPKFKMIYILLTNHRFMNLSHNLMFPDKRNSTMAKATGLMLFSGRCCFRQIMQCIWHAAVHIMDSLLSLLNGLIYAESKETLMTPSEFYISNLLSRSIYFVKAKLIAEELF